MYYFRADASVSIGTGHLMRCLALADALRANGANTHFICRHLPDALADEVHARGHGLTLLPRAPAGECDSGLAHSVWLEATRERDARETIHAMRDANPSWLIVDHYSLDVLWESVLRPHVARLCVIDDLADRAHDCDVLLDQNFYLDGVMRYQGKVPENCVMLLGPRYALLRTEFQVARAHAVVRQGLARRVLVNFGGVDAANLTVNAMQALARLPAIASMQVDVVIGAAHPQRDQIIQACDDYGFTCHIQTRHMADLMRQADLAIGAGGAASWERCCLGLPTIATAVADNQRQLTHDAALAGVLHAPQIDFRDPEVLALHIQSFLESPLLAQHLSQRGMELVDGFGIARVLRALGVPRLRIRHATMEDSPNLFQWRNHPSIRGVSNDSSPLIWGDHEVWLSKVLANADRPLLIGEDAEGPIGVVRFDITGDCAEVSIYLVPTRSAKGLGSELLTVAQAWLHRHRPDVRKLEARVLAANGPSHNLFLSAGFVPAETVYSKRLSQ